MTLARRESSCRQLQMGGIPPQRNEYQLRSTMRARSQQPGQHRHRPESHCSTLIVDRLGGCWNECGSAVDQIACSGDAHQHVESCCVGAEVACWTPRCDERDRIGPSYTCSPLDAARCPAASCSTTPTPESEDVARQWHRTTLMWATATSNESEELLVAGSRADWLRASPFAPACRRAR